VVDERCSEKSNFTTILPSCAAAAPEDVPKCSVATSPAASRVLTLNWFLEHRTVQPAPRGLHCGEPILRMGTPAGSPIVDWSLETVAISDPPASRSDTRTVVWAVTPACNPACRSRFFSVCLGAQCKAMAAKFSSGPTSRRRGSTFANRETTRFDRIANTPEALAAWVARARPTLVAMEPTGGYERTLCLALAEAGVRYVKLHPNTILAFRKARGVRAKTDRIDAMLIAQYLADARGRADLPATFRADELLRALAARLRQLVDARQAEGCRADLASDPFVRESLTLVIGALTQSRD
jgi:hypothetical protein